IPYYSVLFVSLILGDKRVRSVDVVRGWLEETVVRLCVFTFWFFFKEKAAIRMVRSLVGLEMGKRNSRNMKKERNP
ncbi:hypothetical protein, partial [Staphylococcus aureus]|uniref:hypothetical protein n=1 Tax=Staphylococcus aureus TaxID=1280 RepID=UPI000BD11FC0